MTTPEQELWAAVLHREVLDAVTVIPDHRKKDGGSGLTVLEQSRAREWLTKGGDDFRRVCDYAGFDPEAVMSWARTMKHLGWPIERLRSARVWMAERSRVREIERKRVERRAIAAE